MMNRAQKRQLVQTNQQLYTKAECIQFANECIRKKIEAGEMFTLDQVWKITKEYGQKLIVKASDDYTSVISYIIRCKLNWGHKRIERFLKWVLEAWKEIESDEYTVDDVKDYLKAEVNVVVTDEAV